MSAFDGDWQVSWPDIAAGKEDIALPHKVDTKW
jgi:hypothetical protein